jgi:hypothetical protein
MYKFFFVYAKLCIGKLNACTKAYYKNNSFNHAIKVGYSKPSILKELVIFYERLLEKDC